MIMAFSWTTPAVKAKAKDTTRRDWSQKTFELAYRQFERQKPVDAWTNGPRVKGAKPFGKIIIKEEPFWQPVSDIHFGVFEYEYEREGFKYLDANPHLLSDYHRKQLGLKKGETLWTFMKRWHKDPKPLVVARFIVVEIF